MQNHHNLLAIDLFCKLNSMNVLYCHWKSNQHLSEGIYGKTDLDVLVDKSCSKIFEIVLLELGFRRVNSKPWFTYSGIENWIGYDSNIKNFIHIHLHYQIVSGKKYVKEQRIPWENEVIRKSVFDDTFGIKIADPNIELVLLYIRIGLKVNFYQLFMKDKKYKVQLPKNIFNELLYLKKKINLIQVEKITSLMINDKKLKEVLLNIIPRKDLSLTKRDVLELKKGIGYEFDKYSKYSKFATSYKNISNRISYIQYKKKSKLKIFSKKKTLHTGGIVIAFIGADGAGKSTVSKEIYKWLTWKLSVSLIYFGTGDGSIGFTTKLKKYAGNVIRKKSDKKIKKVKEKKISIIRAIYAYLLALERFKKVKIARVLASDGMIILTDRYPQSQFFGKNDGPTVLSKEPKGSIIKKIGMKELELYEKIQRFPPDIIIKLLVDVETAISRKNDHNEETIKKKIEIINNLDFKYSTIKEIDATKNYNDVIEDIKSYIWKMI